MIIKTERLSIHPFEDDDITALCDILTNERVAQTYLLPDFKDDQAVFALAKRLQILSLTENRYVAGIYKGDQLIGMINDVEMHGEKIEMGYVIHPNFWNCGYATEAFRGVIVCLFENGFSEVYTGAFESNLPSIRVMEKSGMKRMNSKAQITYRGKNHSCVYYSIKKDRQI